jgi:hypothetical protein
MLRAGGGYQTTELETLCRAQNGIIILDEAYVDFAEENALELALKYPHVIVSRTFSKAYSLCFQRVGYFVAHPELIAALDKIRDSYNVNGLGQIAAEATLDDLDYYRKIFRRIIDSRTRLSGQLEELGFDGVSKPDKFYLRSASGIGSAGLAPEVAREENPRSLVQPPGHSGLPSHHGRGRGSDKSATLRHRKHRRFGRKTLISSMLRQIHSPPQEKRTRIRKVVKSSGAGRAEMCKFGTVGPGGTIRPARDAS